MSTKIISTAGKVLWSSPLSLTVKEAVLAALKEGANLRGANLSWADLSEANLSWADLSEANLSWADLSGADLSWAKGLDKQPTQLRILPEGALIGWKKCSGGVIVKLRVPEKANRSSATSRKCRAEYVKVLEVIGADVGTSLHDSITKYVKGATVRADVWDKDWKNECAGGIHFFITREEAEDY